MAYDTQINAIYFKKALPNECGNEVTCNGTPFVVNPSWYTLVVQPNVVPFLSGFLTLIIFLTEKSALLRPILYFTTLYHK